MSDDVTLWAGGYTAEFGGRAEGITAWTARDAELEPVRPVPAAGVESPSFLAKHPSLPVLYSADESAGTVTAFRVEGEGDARLNPLATRTAGVAVCHVAVSPGGTHLVACCWGTGEVLLYPLDADGVPGEPLPAVPARDPHAERRATEPTPSGVEPGSRAHCALWLSDGRVLTTDLGFDLLREFTVGADGLELRAEVALPFNSGPRHLVEAPDGAVVVCTEYSCEAIVFEGGEVTRQLPLTPSSPAVGETAAHVTLSDDGILHVGLRGTDRIAVLRRTREGDLEHVGDFASGGAIPRHHQVDGRMLRIAHQGSNEITTHRLDENGLSTGIVARTPVGTPTVLLEA